MPAARGRFVHSACRLSWTPGDISLSAWKLTGPELKDLDGALLRDPKRKTPMFIMSLHQYNAERTEQRTKLRDKRSRDSPQTGGGNRWKSTYVSAVRGSRASTMSRVSALDPLDSIDVVERVEDDPSDLGGGGGSQILARRVYNMPTVSAISRLHLHVAHRVNRLQDYGYSSRVYGETPHVHGSIVFRKGLSYC